MTTLITGATGDIGSLVVERLIERHDHPRVFVRDAEKARARYGAHADVFVGDLADAATLTEALTGVETLLLINSGPELAARDAAAAQAAKIAGVKRLVKLSSFDARENVGTGVWHAQGEDVIRRSGIAFTFVQPSGFMGNALLWAASIKAEGMVCASTGEGKIPFIHPVDIADVLLKALSTSEYDGVSLPITGPEALSYAEMAAQIGVAIGKPLMFQPLSDEEARRQQMVSGVAEPLIAAHLSIFRAIREGRLAAVTDTVEHVLGRKPITFAQWVQENATLFR